MSVRKLRSNRKRKQGRVPTPLWFQKTDLFDAEFDSEDEKNAAEVITKRKSKDGKPRKGSKGDSDEDDEGDLKPLNIFSHQNRYPLNPERGLDARKNCLFKPITMESDSDSEIEEWLPDLPDDGVSLPASQKRNSYKPRKSNNSNNNNNKRKHVVTLDSSSSSGDEDDVCTCSTSTGNTKIMCTSCRVSPATKKPKFVDLTTPTKPSRPLDLDVITIDCSPEEQKGVSKVERHYLDGISPTTASILRDYSFSGDGVTSKQIQQPDESNGRTWVADNDCTIVRSARNVNAVTRNRTQDDVVISGDGRNLSWHKCPRLPCLTATSHPSMTNPEKKEVERTVFPYDTTKIYVLQACQPDSGDTTRKQKLDLVKMTTDFCNRKEEPPGELISSLLDLLREAEDDKLALKIHRCLLEMMEVNPPLKRNATTELPFDWSTLESIMEKLNLNMAVFDNFRATTPATTVANTLALDYIVCHLESDLVHRPMGKGQQIIRSAAASFLNELNESHEKLRSVIKYLQMAVISYNEYDELLIQLSLTRSDSNYRLPLTDIEKIVPLLQRLLDLFVVISKEPRETIPEIVTHLKRVYSLCCLEKRQLLLKTLISPFVKLKLVYLILMDTNGAFGDDVPSSFDTVHDILYFFRVVRPFCIGKADTPPTSPSPHDENSAGHNDAEEIALLLYTAVTSYIAVVKGNFRRASYMRYLEANKKHDLHIDDVRELRNLELKVEELRNCLQIMVGPGMALSSRTTMYLEKLCCLQDLFRNEEYEEDEVIVL